MLEIMSVLTVVLILIFSNLVFVSANESELAEELYKKLFRRQRAEQLQAIKSFQKISNYEKQYSMIMLMAEKVFTVIQDSRARIEASPFIPGVSDFPKEENVREALSNILENTALFADIILRFPDVTASVMKVNNNWDVVLQWGMAFCNQVRYLLDENTIKALSLASQEINHIEKSPDYVNPYRKETTKFNEDVKSGASKKKKKEIKRGPRLTSHTEF